MSDNNVREGKIEEITPDPHNANKGTQAGLRALDKSLRELGAGRSILVDKNKTLIAGEKTTYRAADIGIEDVIFVPTDGTKLVAVQRTDLDLETDEEARQLAYADNRIAELDLEWDYEQVDFDLEQGIDLEWLGFDFEQEPEPDPGAQIDRAEELREQWGVETGQLWRLGEHRLIVGDCTDASVVVRVMDGEKAGAVVTDPPYGIEREGIPNDDPEGLRELYDGCLAVMPITDAVVIAFQSTRLEWIWLGAAKDAGLHPERLLWMYKPNDETFPWRGWLLTSEAIRVMSIGKPDWVEEKPYSHDTYSPTTLGQELEEGQGDHPSVKPMLVVEDLVKRVGGNVYDPFLGSGTTLIACERLGRKCRAVEISPAYCAVAIQRWVDMTSGEPELVE